MALDHQSALLELIDQMRTADPNDMIRRLVGTILQELVDAEATAFLGADRRERSEERTTQRNGTRDKLIKLLIKVRRPGLRKELHQSLEALQSATSTT